MTDATYSDPQPDPAVITAVESLLTAAGLAPSADELAVLVAQYPSHRTGVELLHSLPELRYESPALTFTATPVFSDWGTTPLHLS